VIVGEAAIVGDEAEVEVGGGGVQVGGRVDAAGSGSWERGMSAWQDTMLIASKSKSNLYLVINDLKLVFIILANWTALRAFSGAVNLN
jgi:hypothetical protein